jgi:predicted phosphodiesterase
MPIHMPPLTRREMLKASLGAGICALAPQEALAEGNDRWVLISDTHIPTDRMVESRGIRMAANLQRTVGQITSLDKKPRGVLLNGDCAHLDGQAGDYKLLNELTEPIRKRGIPLHMTLGNHDHRENFWASAQKASRRAMQSRHVSVIETPRANWFLVDSLDKTNVTPGLMGEEQLAWLAKALDARPKKPALVFGHHHMNFVTSTPIGGITDTPALLEILKPRKQVKAYIFGHTHHWELTQHEGIHLINLPPVAYVFKQGDPSGWVDVFLNPDGATLTLNSLDSVHPSHGKTTELTWRE